VEVFVVSVMCAPYDPFRTGSVLRNEEGDDMSVEGTGRVLQLLALLSSRRGWTGDELADRLGVTDRTLRRDIDRLRLLGYQVDGTRGSAGGYDLRAGADLPPLFLDDDEAIAIVAALMVVSAHHSTGMDLSSTTALAKLHHVMPAPLIARMAAVQTAASAITSNRAAAVTAVDPESVAALAEAARDRMRVTFAYRGRDGRASERRIEPHHVITPGRVWYLVGYDLDRDDWRTFRIDRIADLSSTGHRFEVRPLPGGDPAAFLSQAIARTPMAHHARVHVPLGRDAVRARRPGVLVDRITPAGRHACTVDLGADDLDSLVVQIVELLQLRPGATVDASDDVHERLRSLASGLAEAVPGT
jgi:predicted DNA-binding transcriptional regulator YafY